MYKNNLFYTCVKYLQYEPSQHKQGVEMKVLLVLSSFLIFLSSTRAQETIVYRYLSGEIYNERIVYSLYVETSLHENILDHEKGQFYVRIFKKVRDLEIDLFEGDLNLLKVDTFSNCHGNEKSGWNLTHHKKYFLENIGYLDYIYDSAWSPWPNCEIYKIKG